MHGLGVGEHLILSFDSRRVTVITFSVRYVGEDPEPRPNLPSGHIPRSLSVPFTSFLQTNAIKPSDPDSGTAPATYTSLKSNAGILEALRSSLADLAPPLVPGSQPTTFQATRDPGLGQVERGGALEGDDAPLRFDGDPIPPRLGMRGERDLDA